MRTSDAWPAMGPAAYRTGQNRRQIATTETPRLSRAPWARDEEFFALLRAYRRHGGLARQRELLQRGLTWPAQAGCAPPVRFDWANQTWLPLFQFDPGTTAVRADVRRVTRELGPAFDDWHLARWFVEPNSWLGNDTPADALAIDVDAVCAAARADRFVAMG